MFPETYLGKKGIDRIASIGNGLFIVRFSSSEVRDEILKGGFHFFDGKPLIVQAWSPEMDWTNKSVEKIPIWVEFHSLDLTCRGEKSLTKIASSVGKFQKMDQTTLNKDRLMFARILIEVKMDQKFPDVIHFQNENGVIVEQMVYYAWKPVKCLKCNGYGHTKEVCVKKNQQKKVWVVKKKNDEHVTTVKVAEQENVDV